MNEIRLKNFRCFREEQTARLAPLTLLVGENSTGKTSFLALVRALWDIAKDNRIPDFKENPYDLGSFDEIVHRHGARNGQSDSFEAGFSEFGRRSRSTVELNVKFGRSRTIPVPIKRRVSSAQVWLEESVSLDESHVVKVGTARGAWEIADKDGDRFRISADDERIASVLSLLRRSLFIAENEPDLFTPIDDSPAIDPADLGQLDDVARSFVGIRSIDRRPFASAPVRSSPRRTYDPGRPIPESEGQYIPMLLADMYDRDKPAWDRLQDGLVQFGKKAGLFDEIAIKQLGRTGSDPFQVQVRKFAGTRKGPWRNLIDVGYGVSQALPVITELLHRTQRSLFLLQQPEVHLHPMAQAALGSLFCQVASRRKQLIVETHSDHLLDRVRMDIRDGQSALKPEDVSILYFERGDLDVTIHSIQIDKLGNIVGAPPSYGRFFMDETARSLRL